MRAIIPAEIIDVARLSCNITEEPTTWSSAASYNPGDTVALGDGSFIHRYYVCRIANTNKNPPDYEGFEDPAYWREIYGTGGWRMFDGRTSTPDVKVGGITVSVKPLNTFEADLVTTIAFLNLNAESVRVKITDPTEGIVYDETKSALDLENIYDFYEWFFEPTSFKFALLFDFLPPYREATYDITIARDGLASCGEIVMGQAYYLGITGYGSTIGVTDYAEKVFIDADDNGGAPYNSSGIYIKPRKNSKINNFTVLADTVTAAHVRRFLQEHISNPLLFIGNGSMPIDQNYNDETDEWAVVYGFYRDFSMTLDSEPKAIWTLSIEEMT